MFQSEPICVLTAGATIDGRFIDQQVIDDMAELYDPKNYNARINPEHFRYAPKYGSVLSVEKRDNQLFAVLKPNSLLLKTIEDGQLLHTSCEIEGNYQNTGRSYLTGLALTDEPASMGTTEMHLSASAQSISKSREYFSSGATLSIDNWTAQDEPNQEQEDRNLLSRLKRLLSIKPDTQTKEHEKEDIEMNEETKAMFAAQKEQTDALTSAVTLLTAAVTELKPQEPETPPVDKPEGDTTELSAKVDDLSTKFDTLTEKLSKITDEQERDPAGGGNEPSYL
ncbi:phage capsid protein [Vibrio sp. S17_S38]|uniref:GPO family capsid scaffolding protein n=1 Tax=Vibrio sp. S17_S38 TaxID=2720229 RepID=UPI0016804674|nr:GPO family capsid scaffolding protein [Vibrio sp. S17_S38]MBD1572085.1 phage capsid protein [Vibrio sp. S17_S38]